MIVQLWHIYILECETDSVTLLHNMAGKVVVNNAYSFDGHCIDMQYTIYILFAYALELRALVAASME